MTKTIRVDIERALDEFSPLSNTVRDPTPETVERLRQMGSRLARYVRSQDVRMQELADKLKDQAKRPETIVLSYTPAGGDDGQGSWSVTRDGRHRLGLSAGETLTMVASILLRSPVRMPALTRGELEELAASPCTLAVGHVRPEEVADDASEPADA